MRIFLYDYDEQLVAMLYERLRVSGNVFYGTAKISTLDSDPYIKIIPKSNPRLLIRTALSCDVFVLPIVSSFSEAEAEFLCDWIANRTIDRKVKLIVISNTESWWGTACSLAVHPGDYLIRQPRPTPEAQRIKRIEDRLIDASSRNPQINLKIFSCGQLYSYFTDILQSAWSGEQVKCIDEYVPLPLIHIKDAVGILKTLTTEDAWVDLEVLGIQVPEEVANETPAKDEKQETQEQDDEVKLGEDLGDERPDSEEEQKINEKKRQALADRQKAADSARQARRAEFIAAESKKILEASASSVFVFAVDSGRVGLLDIAKAALEELSDPLLLLPRSATEPQRLPSFLSCVPRSLSWHCKNGAVAEMKKIAGEFSADKKPLRILFLGAGGQPLPG